MDLNPHQIEAALFALQSPLSKGVILADEVGLGKTIEAGIVLCQLWAEKKRRILIICPASIRKQWAIELEEKFNLASTVLDAKTYNESLKSGNPRPFDDRHGALITSYHFANSHKEEIRSIPWDLAAIDEAHKLRNCYRESNRIGQGIRWALEERKKLLLTGTPLQNSLLEPYGLSTLIDENIFGHPAPMQRSFRAHFHYLSMTRGYTPGWYAPPPWGANHASLPQGGIHIPAQGATLGIGIPTNPPSEGTPHTSAPATHPNAALLQSTFIIPVQNPGLHPGLVCHPPLGRKSRIPAPRGHPHTSPGCNPGYRFHHNPAL